MGFPMVFHMFFYRTQTMFLLLAASVFGPVYVFTFYSCFFCSPSYMPEFCFSFIRVLASGIMVSVDLLEFIRILLESMNILRTFS
jgi:hypothetical protein